MKEILSLVAGSISILALVPYIRAILKKESGAQPVKASWFIWALTDSIVLKGMFEGGSQNWQMVAITTGTWIIFFLSLKYGKPGWNKWDKTCLLLAVLAIAFWQLFNSPLLGVVIGLSAITIATIPTYVSIWEDYRRENFLAWAMVLSSSVLQSFAVNSYTFANLVQPVWFAVIQFGILFLIYMSFRKTHKLAFAKK